MTMYGQENITVRGIVTERETGESAIGVSVVVRGSSIGTATSIDGDYSLSNVPKNAVLVFSSIGRMSQAVEVNGQTVLNVVLSEDAALLDEIVVVGYGTQTVRDLTAPIAVVKASDISKQAVANPMQALQGKVSGVMVSTSGAPGSSPSIRIRGLGTVESNASPLYVVDDMFVSDISFLSSNDIESMTILKDASSSAIYGVRAANGVVLITTKKGSRYEQKPTIDYNGYVGVQSLSNNFKMSNSEQYKTLMGEKSAIQNVKPIDFTNYTADTDWLDQAVQSAMMHSHGLSISGNTGKSNYFVGLNYLSQEGVIINSDYQRTNLRAAQDINVNKYIKAGYNINLSYADQNNTNGDALGSAFYTPPVIPVFNADGSYSDPSEVVRIANSAAQFHYNKFNKTKGFKYLPNIYLEVKPLADLKLKSSFTLDGSNSNNKVYVPVYRVSDSQKNELSTFRKSDDSYMNYTFDNTLTYSKVINKHRFSAMAGFSMIHFHSSWLEASVSDISYIGESSLYIKNGDQSTLKVNDDGEKIRSLSYFGRFFYAHDDKYLLTTTLRRDGSSTFPSANRWATAPSVGLAWIASEEGFMNSLRESKTIDYLKLRASWGIMGNNNVPQNAYRTVVNSGGEFSTVFGPWGSANISQGANITAIKESTLTWETVREYDLGFEIKMLNSRLDFELDYYHRTTRDAIFPFPVMGVNGSTSYSILRNNADILNKGFEFTLGWHDKINDDFSYNLGFNLAINKNEIVKLAPGTIPFFSGNSVNGSQAIYTQLGRPVGEFYVYDVIGIFQNEQEILDYKSSNGTPIQPEAKPGDFKYADLNDDGILDDLNDRTSIGSYMPKGVYGINLGLNYKAIDFSMDIQGVWGNKIYNFKRVQRFGNENYDHDFYTNRWNGENSSNTYPSADINGRKNPLPNTFWIESGAYIRLRNIQLGYTIPEMSSKKMGISKLRLFVTAQNPLTLFGYNGMTPEMSGTGVQKATEQGIDNQIYPSSATYTFGVNLKF
ncbi:SusC/RagA family TonB-linked outer membrane protein [Bacteroidales bacterium]|nr:SusC/RagA family TonB-linked outer membrane protein [Bacteroidales bacterium]